MKIARHFSAGNATKFRESAVGTIDNGKSLSSLRDFAVFCFVTRH